MIATIEGRNRGARGANAALSSDPSERRTAGRENGASSALTNGKESIYLVRTVIPIDRSRRVPSVDPRARDGILFSFVCSRKTSRISMTEVNRDFQGERDDNKAQRRIFSAMPRYKIYRTYRGGLNRSLANSVSRYFASHPSPGRSVTTRLFNGEAASAARRCSGVIGSPTGERRAQC